MKPLAIGLTAGDPNGIGPEVALRAALRPQPANRRLVLIGHREVWERAARLIGRELPPEVPDLSAPLPRRCTWDPDMAPPPAQRPGQVRADAARAAYAYILSAAAAALNGRLDAIVTAPISKEAFMRAGIREPGHTELLARLTGTRRYAMMLFGTMAKTCSFTGGAFLSDSYSGAVRADIDAATNAWKTANGSGNTSSRMFYTSLTRQLDSYSPITFNGVTPLYPITVEVGRTTPTYYYSMVGYIPEARLLRMNGQYANKDIVTLGSDEWMVFSTSYGGYAFKK